MKLCLVASTGGHLLQLVSLEQAWKPHERFWVTFPKIDAQTLLKNERVVWAYHPTNRNVKNLIKNLWLAWRLLRRERPEVIISTGAGVGVPFLSRDRNMEMESYSRPSGRVAALSHARVSPSSMGANAAATLAW